MRLATMRALGSLLEVSYHTSVSRLPPYVVSREQCTCVACSVEDDLSKGGQLLQESSQSWPGKHRNFVRGAIAAGAAAHGEEALGSA